MKPGEKQGQKFRTDDASLPRDLGSAFDWLKICFNQSEALPRSGKWRVISTEFLHTFLRRFLDVSWKTKKCRLFLHLPIGFSNSRLCHLNNHNTVCYAGQACIITGMMDDWKAMKKWPFEQFQHDPRIADGVFVGQRSTPVPLTNYVTYLKERAANETAPWVIFMSDVFDLYPELRMVSGVVMNMIVVTAVNSRNHVYCPCQNWSARKARLLSQHGHVTYLTEITNVSIDWVNSYCFTVTSLTVYG